MQAATPRTSSSTQIISFSATSYQLVGYASIDGPASSYTVNLAGEPYGASIAAINLGGANQVTFDRFGKASVGGSIIVQVGQSRATVLLDAQTGKAVIQ